MIDQFYHNDTSYKYGSAECTLIWIHYDGGSPGAAPPGSGVQRICCIRNSSRNVISESQRTNLQFRNLLKISYFRQQMHWFIFFLIWSILLVPYTSRTSTYRSSDFSELYPIKYFGRTTEIDLIWKWFITTFRLSVFVQYSKSP